MNSTESHALLRQCIALLLDGQWQSADRREDVRDFIRDLQAYLNNAAPGATVSPSGGDSGARAIVAEPLPAAAPEEAMSDTLRTDDAECPVEDLGRWAVPSDFARQLERELKERTQLFRDAELFLRVGAHYAPDESVSDQNKATGEWLKTRGLATTMLRVADAIKEALAAEPNAAGQVPDTARPGAGSLDVDSPVKLQGSAGIESAPSVENPVLNPVPAAPQEAPSEADGYIVALNDKASGPGGLWFVGAYHSRETADSLCKATKASSVRPFRFTDVSGYVPLPEGPGPQPITVSFKVGIREDGEIVRCCINQGGEEIRLTDEQATALMQQLRQRYPLPAAPKEGT